MKLPDSLTQCINLMGAGDVAARQRVLEDLYPDMLDVARRLDWSAVRTGGTRVLELANEAIVRISRLRREWEDRRHFLATFAQAVRSVRVDAYRARRASRAGDEPLDSESMCLHEGGAAVDLLDLEAALAALEREQPEAASVVVMRLHLEMELAQIAEDTGLPERRCRALWELGRNRLARLLRSYG